MVLDTSCGCRAGIYIFGEESIKTETEKKTWLNAFPVRGLETRVLYKDETEFEIKFNQKSNCTNLLQ